MSTQKWSDDDLDDFFRKSAEESDPPYDPTAWQDLKVRLNNRDRTRLMKWTTPLLLLLLLTGSLIWYRYSPVVSQKSTPTISKSPGTTDSPQVDHSPINKPSAHQEPDAGIANRSAATIRAKSADLRPIKRPPSAGSNASDTRSITNLSNRRKESGLSSVNPLTNKQLVKSEQTNEPPTRLQDGSASVGYSKPPTLMDAGRVIISKETHPPRLAARIRASQITGKGTKQVRLRAGMGQQSLVAGRPVDPPNGTARQDAETGGLGRHRSVMSGSDNITDPARPGLPDSGIRVSGTAVPDRENLDPDGQSTDRFLWPTPEFLTTRAAKWATPSVSVTEPVLENSTGSMQRPSRVRLSGLSIQAVLSPDLSTIGLHNFDRPGSNLGVMIQYQLSERFSVQTGALWSTKVYTSLASEYVWPVNGGMTVWPASITGRCTMFDIPLNLRYDVLLRPGGAGRGPVRWFVSGGVTSYFIKREMYNYNYAWPDDPAIKYRNWNSNKGSSIGLSNLNISLGYERPVSRRLSWQIEPFMKIPLQPIGYFKVRLVSTGAFLSLRYRL